MSSGITDLPIKNINEDAFNIQTYVNGLSDFIQKCDTPMTVSIQGDWGSGKTSMMNMLRCDLDKKKIFSIWFNTWQFSQFNMGDALVFSMLNMLINSLDNGESEHKEKLLRSVEKLAKLGVGAALAFATGGAVNVNNLEVGQQVRKSLNFAEELVNLKRQFQQMVSARLLNEKKGRMVIFVDDLDRLQPAKAVELLEVLKLFLDCEQCVFVLAVDYEIVTLGVKEKYGSIVTEEKGRNFFDKMIQLPFKMPVSNYDITNYIITVFQNMDMRINDKLAKHFVNLIGNSIGYNPRAMKRLFNTYQLLDTITKPIIKNPERGVRERILFGIICMQMKFENLYRYLASKMSYIDDDMLKMFSDEARIDEIKADFEFMEMLDKSGVDVNDRINKIVKFMQCFYKVVDLDGNGYLDDRELVILQNIFRFSRITSICSTEEEEHSQEDRDKREFVKKFANDVNDKIMTMEKMEGLRVSYTKGKDNFKEVSSLWPFELNGYQYELRYYVTAKEGSFAEISLELQNKNGKKHVTEMKRIFGDENNNLLGLEGLEAIDEMGNYSYRCLMLNLIKPDSVAKVAEMFIKAQKAVEVILNKHATE